MPADEGADHRHHLDVAPAHRLLLEDPEAEPRDQPQQDKTGYGTDDTVHQRVAALHGRECEPDDQTAEGELVGDDVGPEIRHCDAEQDGKEHGTSDGEERGAVAPCHAAPDDGGGELDEGIHRRDREAARTALPPQQQPRNDGDVVAGVECRTAAGASGAGPHHRLLGLGAPAADADIEETAKYETEQRREAHDHARRQVFNHATPHRAGWLLLRRR